MMAVIMMRRRVNRSGLAVTNQDSYAYEREDVARLRYCHVLSLDGDPSLFFFTLPY